MSAPAAGEVEESKHGLRQLHWPTDRPAGRCRTCKLRVPAAPGRLQTRSEGRWADVRRWTETSQEINKVSEALVAEERTVRRHAACHQPRIAGPSRATCHQDLADTTAGDVSDDSTDRVFASMSRINRSWTIRDELLWKHSLTIFAYKPHTTKDHLNASISHRPYMHSLSLSLTAPFLRYLEFIWVFKTIRDFFLFLSMTRFLSISITVHVIIHTQCLFCAKLLILGQSWRQLSDISHGSGIF